MLPDLRVFLLSGQSATAKIVANSPASGLGFEVLEKPVHPKELVAKLQRAVLVRNSA
jgi:hypothetical protein